MNISDYEYKMIAAQLTVKYGYYFSPEEVKKTFWVVNNGKCYEYFRFNTK